MLESWWKKGVAIIQNNRESFKRDQKSILESAKNGTKIDENASLERFRHQIAPMSAPGRFPGKGVSEKDDFLAENDAPRGNFGAQLGSKIRQKSHFWV